MKSFGRETVKLVTVTEDLNNRDAHNNPAKLRTEVAVTGCRFRPLPASERTELGNRVTSPYRLTAPPVAAIVNATSRDEVKHDGDVYQIVGGVRVFPDRWGRAYKVSAICERYLG